MGPSAHGGSGRDRALIPRAAAFAALVVAWIVAATAFAPARVEAQPGGEVTISSIRFEGNEHLDQGKLLSVMRQKAPPRWNFFARKSPFVGPDLLAADLANVLGLYRERGYLLARIREATVDYDSTGSSVDVTIRIAEGPLVRQGAVEFRGVDARWQERVERLWRIEPGEPLIASRLAASALAIESFYADQGLLEAGVIRQIRLSSADVAPVIVEVDPGAWVGVDSVTITGLEHTDPLTVRKEMTFHEGSLLTGKRLFDTRQRLVALGIFQRVSVTPTIHGSVRRDRAHVRIHVAERPRSWIGAGLGYSSADEVRALAEWGRINLGGRGRKVSLDGNIFYSIDPGFRGGGVNFREGRVGTTYFSPHTFGTRNRATASSYVNWLQEETFHERTLGVSLTGYREINRTTRLLLGLENRQVRSTDPDVQPDYTTRITRVEWSDDRRDNPFDATSGFYSIGSTELSGGVLGGDSDFLRYTANWQGYRRMDERWTLAGRLRVGLIDAFGRGPAESVDSLRVSRVPWGERFRLGGSNTVRGYGEREVGRQNEDDEAVGGLVLVQVSAEVRFPVWKLISGGLFFDAGNVWADASEIKLRRFTDGISRREYDPLDVFYGMGTGLRFATPVGPLRVDLGIKLGSGRRPGEGPSELHVALGQAF